MYSSGCRRLVIGYLEAIKPTARGANENNADEDCASPAENCTHARGHAFSGRRGIRNV